MKKLFPGIIILGDCHYLCVGQNTRRMQNETNDERLLELFNQRDKEAFGQVYRRLYRELYLYAARLFEPLNLPPEDFIQDVFLDIWQRHSLRFPSLAHVKSLCFTALKNAYKNQLRHSGHRQRFEMECRAEQEFSTETEEAERIAQLYDALHLLPPDLAAVVRLSLEGFKAEEIARKQGVALQTVYNRRRDAVLLLRKHFNVDK